jgi:predicted DNA binding protein
MWNLKFRVLNKDSIYTPPTLKFKIIDYFYPVDRYKKGNKILILGIHTLEGEEKEQNKFINLLKKNKKVKKFKKDGNKFIMLVEEEEKFYELLYNPELYLPSPTIIKEGYEYWNVAAWDRSVLEGLIKEIGKWKDKLQDFHLLKLQKSDLNEVYFPMLHPNLPEKQKESFIIALKNGYYSFPRKKDLKDLARIAGVSVSTYHENLRKAEAKLLPFFGHNIKF